MVKKRQRIYIRILTIGPFNKLICCTNFVYDTVAKICKIYLADVDETREAVSGEAGLNTTDVEKCMPFFKNRNDSCFVRDILIFVIKLYCSVI